MGNEGSLPTDEDIEGFEYQARSPPSAIPPGGTSQTYVGGNTNDHRLQHPGSRVNGGGQGSGGHGGRLKGNPFKRGNHAHNQNSFGIERAPGQSSLSSYPTPIKGEDLAYMGQSSVGVGGQHHPQQQAYPSHAQHPQQYPQQQQQQQIYAQQQYQQQQQQQQQHYHPQGQQPQYPQMGRKVRPGQRAGAAILNGMRNLNISSAMNRIGSGVGKSPGGGSPSRMNKRQQQQQQRRQQQQQTVNEWETRWDEDSDEEDEDVKPGMLPPQQHSIAGADGVPTTAMTTPLGPPELDSGFSGATAALVSPTKPMGEQLQAQQALFPPTAAAAVTPSTLGTPTPSEPKSPDQTVTDDEIENENDDDGVEWDTGKTTTPNVEQFMPLLRVLGKGSFGKVVLVQKRVGREQGSLFAMKILKKSHLVRRRQIERTRTERKVLSAVNHPFIMKLHYAFQSPDKLYLVLDYCPGGELFFHLSRFRRFPERVARFYAAELLLALGHLHKRGIIYRDLKPENVLLDADGHVKLGDFGLAKAGIRHAYEGATSMCGTPEYMAPEVLSQQGHGFCVDYWGLGMLTYEMMTGLPPWYTTDRAKLFRRLRSAPLDIPPYFSAASAAFTTALLERNPRRRLGVTGIRAAMENDFFKSISWRALYGRRVEAPIRPCEGWTPPGNESPTQEQQQQQGPPGIPTDLDAATANFDNQFTRMPVESVNGNGDDDEDLEELHEDTFVGFTFDDNDRDELEAAQQLKQQQQQQQLRQRTQNYSG
eukprot:CAMPEP_0116144498 /NCGR_PEP_ID=MMETSP0329-20121206/16039_1 /TAXON_ID=697910 /ORGANISM="Pseudo-nitzschia arenysensis, Strain B593" /LENGTH=758 /DNA_ID=CAMNT_0003639935 /DNA_START=307 /DNA_END=2579 /DNA_ORIENTATION=-